MFEKNFFPFGIAKIEAQPNFANIDQNIFFAHPFHAYNIP